MSGDFWKKLAIIPEQYHTKVEYYSNLLTGYLFNISLLRNATISVATEVFTRLNVGGKSLSLFEFMVAKTYSAPDPNNTNDSGFDMAVRYEQLRNELRPVQYDTIASATVLQVVAMLATGGCSRKQILDIDKQLFIATWPRAVKSIKLAVDFLRDYGIPVSQLLPYNALLVPLSYFFDKHANRPSGIMLKRIEDFFWRCSLGSRYSWSVEAKLANDVNKIDRIINDEQPHYEWSINITPEAIAKDGWFVASRSYNKAILCLLAKQHPLSFKTNLNVRIDNLWLSKSTSQNYHHFFPKAFLKKNDPTIDYWQINHIANITIVDDYLNKNDIRAKSPARYIDDFSNVNIAISETLSTHLIGDLDEFGVKDNNYLQFFNARLSEISEKLSQLLINQETDNQIQVEQFEEAEMAEEENID